MQQTPALTSAAATRSEESAFATKDVFLATLRERLRLGREKQERKVQRYRPGLAPSWAEEAGAGAAGDAPVAGEAGRDLLDARAAAERRREERQRRRELEERGRSELDPVKQENAAGGARRRPVVAEVVSVSKMRPTDGSAYGGLVVDPSKLQVQDLPTSSDSDSSSDEDEDEAERRRARARARAQQRRREEEEGVAAAVAAATGAGGAGSDSSSDSDSSSSEESSSEEESDSEDEQTNRLLLLKPTFIPKGRRATVAERERIDAEAEAVRELEKRRQNELKAEARLAVLEEIQRGTQKPSEGLEGLALSSSAAHLAATNRDLSISGNVLRTKDGMELVVDSSSEDDSEDELELERWKIRELQRLRRDRDARRKHEVVQAEVERRRAMTDAEILAENERLGITGKDRDADEGPKMQFMQRYYHKGVFFMDENEKSELFQRDFTAPTGEDKDVDKAALPQVMQVKNWGKRGRTKYTHLVDQDTSDLANNPWASRTARHTLSKMNRFRGAVQP